MSFLEIGGRRHPIPVGEVIIGSNPANEITLGGEEVQVTQAILEGLPDGQVTIRKANPDVEILINGVRLGPHPTPLLHGDKVEMGGRELLFVDERRSGSTQYVKAAGAAGMGAALKLASKRPATGGRLVSLTDGREYSISGARYSLVGKRAATWSFPIRTSLAGMRR